MDFVYSVESAKQAELKKVLEEESLAKDSFASCGYTLKEGKSVGGEDGRYYLKYSAVEPLAAKLKERLSKIEGLREESGENKQKILDALALEGDAAASGFGSIFG